MGACSCPPSAARDATRRCHSVACRYIDRKRASTGYAAEGAAAKRFLCGRYGSLRAAVEALSGSTGSTPAGRKQTTRSPYAELALKSRALAPPRASARLRRAAAAGAKK